MFRGMLVERSGQGPLCKCFGSNLLSLHAWEVDPSMNSQNVIMSRVLLPAPSKPLDKNNVNKAIENHLYDP